MEELTVIKLYKQVGSSINKQYFQYDCNRFAIIIIYFNIIQLSYRIIVGNRSKLASTVSGERVGFVQVLTDTPHILVLKNHLVFCFG